MNLSDYVIKECPAVAYYIPDFITKEEEDYLLKQFYSAPKPKWTFLSNRRLQNWGGLPHSKGMIREPLPKWLDNVMTNIYDMKVFPENKKPNHALLNEYQPGQGILAHHDGPLYYPTITTVSLGSHTLLDFYEPLKEDNRQDPNATSYQERYSFSLLLEARSLVILQDQLYTHYMHGIREQTADSIDITNNSKVKNINLCKSVDLNKGDMDNNSITLSRSTRVSFTIRHVPNVIKINLPFLKSK